MKRVLSFILSIALIACTTNPCKMVYAKQPTSLPGGDMVINVDGDTSEGAPMIFNVNVIDEDTGKNIDDLNVKISKVEKQFVDGELKIVSEPEVVAEWNTSETNPFVSKEFTNPYNTANSNQIWYYFSSGVLPKGYNFYGNYHLTGSMEFTSGTANLTIKLKYDENDNTRDIPINGTYSRKICIKHKLTNEIIKGLECEFYNCETDEVVASWNTNDTDEMLIENLKYEFDDDLNTSGYFPKGKITYALRIKNMPKDMVYDYDSESNYIFGLNITQFRDENDIEKIIYLYNENDKLPEYTTLPPTFNETTTMIEYDKIKGDATCNGTVDIRDVSAIAQYIVKLKDFDEQAILNADIIEDGTIDIKDITSLKSYLIHDKNIL